MFTGIIDHCGTITQIESIPSGLRLTIQHLFQTLDLGESIAIDGICLTVTQFDNDHFTCDLSPETLNLTAAAQNFKPNHPVNLERALLPTSRLGGHFVMGHIDQTAKLKTIQKIDDFTTMTFAGLDDNSKKFLVKKGSIAINGVSLTINDLTDDGFSVMLIPHTLERTNLANLKENDTINIEFDMLARVMVEHINRFMDGQKESKR